MKMSSRVATVLLIALVGAATGCGEDGGSPTNPDAGSDASDTNVASSFPRTFSGTTEEMYSWVASGGTGLIRPPGPRSDTATIVPNADYTRITIETGACSLAATFVSVREQDGMHIYEPDPAATSCTLRANGETAVLSDLDGRVEWSEDTLTVSISGDAAISLGSSLFFIEFESI